MLDRPIARRRLLHGTAGALALAALRPLGALAAPDEAALDALIADAAEPLPPLDDPAFAAAFDRFAEARVVLMGEATHGSAEFYRARAAITRRLVERHGFTIVAVEADWPDAAHVDAYVRGGAPPVAPAEPFARF
ncbi:MAG TPA: erythromycin esterase family protein, partial [Alphaproteobacteria bacterium]|nr:erythromycin esterase family protein [Alphaproteobacteria bacterium]